MEGAYIFVKHYFQCNLHNFIDTHFNISILLYKIIWNSLIWSDPFMTWRTLNCRFQCQPIEMSLSKISIVSILRFYHSSFSFAFSDEPKHMFHGIRRRIISCQNFHPGCLWSYCRIVVRICLYYSNSLITTQYLYHIGKHDNQ